MPAGLKLKPRPLELYHERTRRRGVNPLVYWPARLVIKTGILVYFRVRRLGREHVPNGGLILASNHRSFLDPFVIGCCVRRPIYFVAKRELFRNPLVGWFLNCMGAFPVRRGQADEESVETALALLDHGEAVVMFPEGTRIVNGSLGRPKRGVGRLALQSGAPVVPVAVTGSEHARDGWRIKPVRVHVRCGAPLAFPKVADPSPFLAGEVTERIWPCVELQWEWLGGLPPLRTAAVVGADRMGTAVASVLARAGLEVQLGCRTEDQARRLRAGRTHGARAKAIDAKTVPEIELAGVDLVVLAVPCASLPDVIGELGSRVGERSAVLVSGAGLVPPLGTTPTAYVSERVHARAVATMAVPARLPVVTDAGGSVSLATRNADLRRQLGDVLRAGGLTVDATDDVTGTELAACAKSAAALASSAAAPRGANVADAAAGRILSEVHELALASGGRSETFAGLAARVDAEPGAPADSIATVPLLGRAFERQGVEAPVTAGLDRVLAGKSSPDQWLESMRSSAADRASVGE
jgi:glycerol-3-phosphate dehydrogenase (NAD(P)+)